MSIEPRGDLVEPIDLGSVIAVELAVAVELLAPAADLPLQPSVAATEIGEAGLQRVESTESGNRVGRRQFHLPLHRPFGPMGLRHRDRGAEPVNGLHQVEYRPEDIGPRLGGDEGWMRHIRTGERAFGDVTILVNVVGGLKGPITREFMAIDDDQWDFAMTVNLRSTFQCMQAALEVMIPQRRGRIVNIASVSWAGSPDHADYAAAKAGVVALTRSVASQVAEHQITVNAVAPGPTLTDVAAHSDPGLAISVPLGRPNIPEDVADAVRFLCSDAARNISGQILNVVGGLNPSM